jgi:parallel beta-helix repeat protein
MTLLLALLASVPAQAATAVCGTIATNTTWTTSGSPYVITCSTTVAPGVTLTINAGVDVDVDPNVALMVQGTLDVNGTSSQPVIIDRNVASSPWSGIQLKTNAGGHATIDHAVIDGANTGIDVECCWGHAQPAVLNYVTLTNHTTALGGYAGTNVLIDNSEIAYNTVGMAAADKIATNSWIHDNTYGLAQGAGGGGGERMTVEGCTVEDNNVGVWGSNSVNVRYSLVTGNQIGVQSQSNVTIQYNDITANTVGVRITGSSNPSLTLNNLQGNTTWAVEHLGSSLVTAPNNWWGTTSSALIDAMVWDLLDDPNRGLLDYTTPALVPVATTYLPPSATSIGWGWSATTSLGVDFTCNATDDGTIVSVGWLVTDGTSTWTATTPGLAWSWVAPTDGVYDVVCTVTDNTGLHDTAPSDTFWVAADSDLDGVVDDWDLCPGTPAVDPVDEDGCSVLCDEAYFAGGVLSIPAVWLPSGACLAIDLTGPTSAMTVLGTGTCSADPCAPGTVYNTVSSGTLLVLPEVWVGPNDYTVVLKKVGPTFTVLSAVAH